MSVRECVQRNGVEIAVAVIASAAIGLLVVGVWVRLRADRQMAAAWKAHEDTYRSGCEEQGRRLGLPTRVDLGSRWGCVVALPDGNEVPATFLEWHRAALRDLEANMRELLREAEARAKEESK